MRVLLNITMPIQQMFTVDNPSSATVALMTSLWLARVANIRKQHRDVDSVMLLILEILMSRWLSATRIVR